MPAYTRTASVARAYSDQEGRIEGKRKHLARFVNYPVQPLENKKPRVNQRPNDSRDR